MLEQREYGPEMEFGEFEIERDPFRGVVIRVKSKDIKAFFERFKIEEEPIKVSKKWPGFRYYNIPNDKLPPIPDVSFLGVGEGMFIGDTILNLSFLRAVDLDKGVEIVFPGLIAEPVKDSFRKGVLDRTALLYGDYIRPSWVRSVFSTKTVFR